MAKQWNVCPKCGGELSKEIEEAFGEMWKECLCQSCGFEYVEVFEMQFVRNEDADENELDSKGDVINER